MWMYVTTTAYPQNLTSQERDRAVAELKRSRKDFLDSIAGLSQAQWSFKPSIFRWSVGECAEHIAAAEDSYFDLIMKLMQSPAMPEKKGEVAGKDDFVLREMVDRTSKRFAPESLRPNRRWSGPQDIIDHFNRSRDRLIRYVETTNDDMRAHVLPHRAVGPIDAYQWILLASVHMARHTLQIQEVKADRRFPRAPEGQSP